MRIQREFVLAGLLFTSTSAIATPATSALQAETSKATSMTNEQQVVESMLAYTRTYMLKHFRKEKSITQRIKAHDKIPHVLLPDLAAYAKALQAGSKEPCIAFITKGEDRYSVHLWLPGIGGPDLYDLSFNHSGSFAGTGAILYSSMLVGK